MDMMTQNHVHLYNASKILIFSFTIYHDDSSDAVNDPWISMRRLKQLSSIPQTRQLFPPTSGHRSGEPWTSRKLDTALSNP